MRFFSVEEDAISKVYGGEYKDRLMFYVHWVLWLQWSGVCV